MARGSLDWKKAERLYACSLWDGMMHWLLLVPKLSLTPHLKPRQWLCKRSVPPNVYQTQLFFFSCGLRNISHFPCLPCVYSYDMFLFMITFWWKKCWSPNCSSHQDVLNWWMQYFSCSTFSPRSHQNQYTNCSMSIAVPDKSRIFCHPGATVKPFLVQLTKKSVRR